jgi:large subunit ribosomal protein L32
MAVPKRRHSKTRRDKRRTNWKLASPALNVCSHCGATKRPHQVCMQCGHYGDREIIEPAES